MQQIGLQPSIATFGALIGQEGLKWRSVSQLLRVMTTNHLRQGSTTHHRHLFAGGLACMGIGWGQAEPDQCKRRYRILF